MGKPLLTLTGYAANLPSGNRMRREPRTMTKSTWRLLCGLLALFGIMAVAVACGDDDSTSSTTGGGASPGASSSAGNVDLADDQSLTLNLAGEPDSLDPSKASFSTELTIITQLFTGPFKFDKD